MCVIAETSIPQQTSNFSSQVEDLNEFEHTLKWGLIWGQSRTMPGRGFNQVLWTALCNFINLPLTRKEDIYFFTMGKERSRQKTLTLFKFKVTSALKLPLLLRIERTDPPTWVSYFPGGSYSFASHSHPTACSQCLFAVSYLFFSLQDFWLLIHQQHLKKVVLELTYFQCYPCHWNRKWTFLTVLD